MESKNEICFYLRDNTTYRASNKQEQEDNDSNVKCKKIKELYNEIFKETEKNNKTEKDDEYYIVIFKLLQEALKKIKITEELVNINSSNRNDEKLRFIDINIDDKSSDNNENNENNVSITIQTFNLVGVVQVSKVELEYNNKKYEYDVKIIIITRFDKDENRPFFLINMLSYETLKLNEYYPSFEDNDTILGLFLVYLFKSKLLDAFRQGLYRTYHTFEENNPKFRGSIDIARHIKNNIIFTGNISYRYRENTIKNYINYLIILAYKKLLKKFPNVCQMMLQNDIAFKGAINQLSEILYSYNDYSERYILSKCLNPIKHPYYYRYEELRKVCIRILNNLGISIFNTGNDTTNGILLYIPDLWESFLGRKLKNISGYKVLEQEELEICKKDKIGHRTIRPDFVIKHGELYELILDAKFKPAWYKFVSTKNSLSNLYLYDDYLQVVNYMLSFNTDKCAVIFPAIKNKDEEEFHFDYTISDHQQQKKFICLVVFVPEPSKEYKFSDWSNGFNEGINKTIECIENILKNPSGGHTLL